MGHARIALDAMGGDNAPVETVRGAVEAVRADPDLAVCLVGDRAVIEPELARGDGPRDRLEIVHATQVIRGHEAPVEALKSRPDASIKRAAELLKAGAADGLVAAGRTGRGVVGAAGGQEGDQGQQGRRQDVFDPALAEPAILLFLDLNRGRS